MPAKVTLESLIRMTPMEEVTRVELLGKLGEFSQDQKFRISMLCWDIISSEYDLNLAKKINAILDEVAEKKKEFSMDSLKEADEIQKIEFSRKLTQAQSEEELEKVHKEIGQMSTNNS
ncbi:hypothetical protein HYW54_02410 [Candidatus Gottesmanbacteria bacterium]|nr:hypothetical protein [Candidatus Gottesmanbacteria bacterium]